jgi:hypothetical protein
MCFKYSRTYVGEFLITIEKTNLILQSSDWEDSSHSASRNILRHLANPKIHHLPHYSPPPVRIMRQMNPLQTLTR